jgi:outer membrane receptor protein involved in Fe transport
VFGQRLKPHVINNYEVGLEIAAQGFVLLVEGFVFHEVAHDIENGAVEDFKALLDGLVAQGLGQRGFADAGRTEEKDILGLADEVAGGQIENLLVVVEGLKLKSNSSNGLRP